MFMVFSEADRGVDPSSTWGGVIWWRVARTGREGVSEWDVPPGGVLNFELGTDVRPEVLTTTL